MHSFQMPDQMAGGSRSCDVQTSEQINEIAAALSKAQGAMKPAVKDATNPHFRSKYADLAANVEAAREPMAANGLSAIQQPVTVDGGVAVTTRLLHSSGQWIEFEPLTVPFSKADAHGIGSATTYARRYALGAALGLVAEDDDGNTAVAPAKARAEQAPAAPTKPEGYDAWLRVYQAAAKKGIEELRKAYKAAPVACRDYLTKHDAQNYEKARADAETATKNEQAVPA
jgi:hypothetical protein